MLAINEAPVTIEYIEKAISDKGFEEGWIRPEPPAVRTGKKVAVVGSGPGGLAAAQQLNRAGHHVTVFERDNYIGGLLTLGIPDFKLDKALVRRRVDVMKQEGIEFRTGINVGVDYPVQDLENSYDAVCLAGGVHSSPGSDGSRKGSEGHSPGDGIPDPAEQAAGWRAGESPRQDHRRREARGYIGWRGIRAPTVWALLTGRALMWCTSTNCSQSRP